MIVEGIKIIKRKGGIEERKLPRRQHPADPWSDVEDAIHKSIAVQGMWDRYKKGLGEFEPAFFCASDDFHMLSGSLKILAPQAAQVI